MTQGQRRSEPSFSTSPRAQSFASPGLTGFRFLNGQITNDLRKASETAAIEACVLNAKGKLERAHFHRRARRKLF